MRALTSGQGRQQDSLQRKAMTRQTAIKMIKRRALYAGLPGRFPITPFGGRESLSTCATAAIWKPLRVSQDMNLPGRHSSITGLTRNCQGKSDSKHHANMKLGLKIQYVDAADTPALTN